MMIKREMQKGFTLIELLLVIAIIAIMSTMILMMLDSGRERAEVGRYKSYAVQMQRLVAASAAAGQFDPAKVGSDITAGDAVCLGDVGYTCTGGDEVTDDAVYKALTYLTEMPKTDDDNSRSPYNKTQGVWMQYMPGGGKYINVHMYLLNDDVYLKKVCDSMNWATDTTGNTCYTTVKLHSRL